MAKGKNGSGKSRGSRRSKSESMTGAKADTVEMRKGGDLPLGEPIVLDDGDFDLHLRSLKSALERQKQAKNLYDGVCKAAKKVSEDLLAAIKRAVKFEGMTPEDIKKQMQIDGYALRRVGSSVQLTIHDALLGNVKEGAYKRGQADGKAGRSANSTYPEGSDLAQQYAKGWAHGTGENLGLKPEEVEAAQDAGETDAHDAEDGDAEDEIDLDDGRGDRGDAERQPVLAH